MSRFALRTTLVAGGALLLVAAGFLRVQAVRLNQELAHAVFGNITGPVLSGEGSRVFYLANILDAEVQELFVSPSDGSGGAVRLSANQITGGDVQSFLLAPGEERVFYRADQDVDGVIEFYSAPVDGSLAPVKLNGSLTAGLGFVKFSPDGTRALFVANNASGMAELYSVPMDGSLAPVKLNGTLVAGGAVRNEVVVSPDGTRVLYMAFQSHATTLELFSVPIGGGAAVKLNGTLVAQGDVESAKIGPASAWVVYTADQITNNVVELFGVPIGGGTAVRLNAPPIAGFAIASHSLAAAPGVPRVVYRATQDVAGRNELYTVPADGSQPPLKLNAPVTGSGVSSEALTPDGERAVYLSSAGELFGAPVDGSQAAVRLDSPLPSGVSVYGFQVNQDGSRVVYWTRDTNVSGDATDIYAVPPDGSTSAVLLTAGLTGNRVPNSPALAPDGTHLVYLRRNGPTYLDLYGVPIDGSVSPVKLNDDVLFPYLGLYPAGYAFGSSGSMLFLSQPSGVTRIYRTPLDASSAPLWISEFEPRINSVTGFQLSTDRSRVLFTASQPPFNATELFCVASDGQTPAVRVNDPLPPAPYQGDVTEFVLTSDASTTVFAAPQDVYGYAQLFAVPSDGSAGPQRLEDELGVVSNLVLTPDGESVLYLFRPYFDNPFENSQSFRLVPLDGSQSPVEISEVSGAETPRVTPDGARVIFLGVDFYQDGTLYSLPLDGSAAASVLGLVDVQYDFALSPDGSHVFYRRGGSFVTGEPTETELWVAAVDGSGAPVVLNDPLPTYGEVDWFGLTPGGERVVYRANQNALGRNELFSALSDGSGPSTRLNGTLPTNGNVLSMAIAKAGPNVVYLADQAVDERYELYRVPNDGSSAPVKLNPTLVSGGDVVSFALSPDGEHAVYLADQVTNDVVELFSVALDGGSPAVRISAPMVTGGDVASRQIAPDSGRVVYLADQLVNNVVELFSVSITGGAVVRLNSDLVSGGNVSAAALTVSADSRWVVYQADANVDGVNELFRARIDRAGIPERLNGPLVQGGAVGGLTPPFRLGPDGETVVFVADQLQNDVFELFSAVSKPFRIRQR